MPVITEATPRDVGERFPDHVLVDMADDAPVSEFARIGREVGLGCRGDFESAYPPGTNADSRLFFPALGSAVSDALRKMKAGGAGGEQIAAWQAAFWEGMALSDEEWKLLSIVEGNV